MSILSLPDELLLQICHHVPTRKLHRSCRLDILLVNKRIHDVAAEAIYSHPNVCGYHNIRSFVRTLHLHGKLANHVKTLSFSLYHEESGPIIPFWTLLRVPMLHNCTQLYVYGVNFTARITVSFIQILSWVEQCLQLRRLELEDISNDAVDIREFAPKSIEQLGIMIPDTLVELSIIKLQMDALYSLRFWQFCQPWIRHLSITVSGPSRLLPQHFDGAPALRVGLRSVELRAKANHYHMDLYEALPHLFQNLEFLHADLPCIGFTGSFSKLRLLRTTIYPDTYNGQCVKMFCESLKRDCFPVLEELRVLSRSADTDSITKLVRKVGLQRQLRAMNVQLTFEMLDEGASKLRITIATGN